MDTHRTTANGQLNDAGFDRTVRLFAPFFERHLGGDIPVIPENAAGAGGRLGATKVYRARADGSTLGIFNLPGFVLPEVLGERIDYDLRRLSWNPCCCLAQENRGWPES